MILVYATGTEHYEIIGIAEDEAGARELLGRRIAHQDDERTRWSLDAEEINFLHCNPGEYILTEENYPYNNERAVATRKYMGGGKFGPWVLKDS